VLQDVGEAAFHVAEEETARQKCARAEGGNDGEIARVWKDITGAVGGAAETALFRSGRELRPQMNADQRR
jgi:hypothetical protein